MKKCILLVGVQDSLLELLSGLMNTFGYRVLPTFSINIAGWLVMQRRFALVVVNTEYFPIGLYEFLSKVREHQHIPIAALSGSTSPDIQEWRYDVDFTLSTQLHPRKMMAYFIALMKQHRGDTSFIVSRPLDGWPIEQGDFFVDQLMNWVSIGERSVSLSPQESQLLVYFLLRSGKTLSYQTVCTALWIRLGSYGCDDKMLVEELRKKIEPDPEHPLYLQNTPCGYRFYDTADVKF